MHVDAQEGLRPPVIMFCDMPSLYHIDHVNVGIRSRG